MTEKEIRERPLECSSCTRKISVKYSEVADTISVCVYMCSECPKLQEHLFHETDLNYSESSGLVCGHCNTSSESVQRGELLGCLDCYQTFENFINNELINFSSSEEGRASHEGHKPGEIKEISPTSKILALNKALAKTLNEENYEQAAWIRDQIQELKKKATENE